MISIIITAYKEAQTIKKAIESIIIPAYSGISPDYELIQVSPDDETLNAGRECIEEHSNYIKHTQYIQIKDPLKGKPYALNLALKRARGDILILTDGDVFFDKNAVKEMLDAFVDKSIGGVTGRPIAQNDKSTMMGYYANMLADAAHHKRTLSMTTDSSGKSSLFIPRNKFFPLSGYIMAIRNIHIQLPLDCLADDAYISYILKNMNLKLVYNPRSKVFVRYPLNLKDYFIQKKRSLGGYIQLWKYDIVTKETKSRSFWHELQYFWFPIKYAQNLNQFFWSLYFYPVRLFTWAWIWWERKILNKDFSKTWQRVESTK